MTLRRRRRRRNVGLRASAALGVQGDIAQR